MIVSLRKFFFDPTDANIEALAKQLRTYPNIVRGLVGEGILVACQTCLEKIHLAPWRTATEIQQQTAKFQKDHEHL